MILFWILRIVSNYEHNEGDFVPIKAILDEAKENYNMSEVVLGVVISNIWGGKVKKVCSSSTTGSGYRNLRKRTVVQEETDNIRTLDDGTIKKLKTLSSKHDGWILDFFSEGQFSFIKVPFSQSGTTVDGRRLVYEITGSLDQSTISVCTHGQPVIIEELGHSLTFYTLETIIRLVDSTSICLGNVIVTDNSEGNMNNLKRHVAGTTVVNIATSTGKQESRLISTSCLVLTSGNRACKNCSYAAKLWHNRQTRRKAKGENLHKNCNVRFLARGGLEEKVCQQRKESRSDSVRERRSLNEMIEFSECDSVDLRKIIENVESKDVPEDMALLWEMQQKQLASKSPAGYRWHPR